MIRQTISCQEYKNVLHLKIVQQTSILEGNCLQTAKDRQDTVDEKFPRVTPASFVGDVMPTGITKISYTVYLSGLTPLSLT